MAKFEREDEKTKCGLRGREWRGCVGENERGTTKDQGQSGAER